MSQSSSAQANSAIAFFLFRFRVRFLEKCLHSSQSMDGTRSTSVITRMASVNNWQMRYLMTSGLVTTMGGAVSLSRRGAEVIVVVGFVCRLLLFDYSVNIDGHY
mmetsp:Transcript_25651/g.54188  ORF Transcript_25651/g.54188 Transcript_25651/m.54188 type:complete len:104 (+) Transcript_25651:315-626(+)